MKRVKNRIFIFITLLVLISHPFSNFSFVQAETQPATTTQTDVQQSIEEQTETQSPADTQTETRQATEAESSPVNQSTSANNNQQKASGEYHYTINFGQFLLYNGSELLPDPYGVLDLYVYTQDYYIFPEKTINLYSSPNNYAIDVSTLPDAPSSVDITTTSPLTRVTFTGYVFEYDVENWDDALYSTYDHDTLGGRGMEATSSPISATMDTKGQIILPGDETGTNITITDFSINETITADPIPQNLVLGDQLPDPKELVDIHSSNATNIQARLLNENEVAVNKVGSYIAEVQLTNPADGRTKEVDVPVTVGWGNTLTSRNVQNNSSTAFALSSIAADGTTNHLIATQGNGFVDGVPINNQDKGTYIHTRLYKNNGTDPINSSTPYVDFAAKGQETGLDIMDAWNNQYASTAIANGDLLSYSVNDQTGKNNIYYYSAGNPEMQYQGFPENIYEMTTSGLSLLQVNHLLPKTDLTIEDNADESALAAKAEEFFDLSSYQNMKVVGFKTGPDLTNLGEQNVTIQVQETTSLGNKVNYLYKAKLKVIRANTAPTATAVPQTVKQATTFNLAAKDLVKDIQDDNDAEKDIAVEYVGDLPDTSKLGEQQVKVRLTDSQGAFSDIPVKVTIVPNVDLLSGNVQVANSGEKLSQDVNQLVTNPYNYNLTIVPESSHDVTRRDPGFEFVTITVKEAITNDTKEIELPVNIVDPKTTVYDLDQKIALNVLPMNNLTVFDVKNQTSDELNQQIITDTKAISWDMLTGAANPVAVTANDIQAAVDNYEVELTATRDQAAIKKTINVAVTGQLAIVDLPDKIDFGTISIFSQPKTFYRQETDFEINITNTLGSDWNLKIQAEPLENGETHHQLNGLTFIDQNGQKTAITNQLQTIAQGDGKTNSASISWADDQGIVYQANPAELRLGDYQTQVTFSLEDTP